MKMTTTTMTMSMTTESKRSSCGKTPSPLTRRGVSQCRVRGGVRVCEAQQLPCVDLYVAVLLSAFFLLLWESNIKTLHTIRLPFCAMACPNPVCIGQPGFRLDDPLASYRFTYLTACCLSLSCLLILHICVRTFITGMVISQFVDCWLRGTYAGMSIL